MFPLLRVADVVIGDVSVSRLPHRAEIRVSRPKPSGTLLVICSLALRHECPETVLTAGRAAIKYVSVPPREAAHFVSGKSANPMHAPSTSHLLPTYARVDLAFERGDGAWLTATNGERYLDFTSGVAVNALGHGHPQLVAAISEQANKLIHVSNLYRIPEAERLAARLCEASFADLVFSGQVRLFVKTCSVQSQHEERAREHQDQACNRDEHLGSEPTTATQIF